MAIVQETIFCSLGDVAGGRERVLPVQVRPAADGGQLRHPVPGHRLVLSLRQRGVRATGGGHQVVQVSDKYLYLESGGKYFV